MLRHIANLGLLFSFMTLAATGVMSFFLPFSITTTRLHLVFGLATLVLVGLHLATRLRYFIQFAKQSVQLHNPGKATVPRWLLASIVAVWAGLLAASFYGIQPASGLVANSYESRHKAEIFRARPGTVYEHLKDQTRIVQLRPAEDAVLIELQIEYANDLDQRPAAAVWAETTRGVMIQTLFLDERLAFSEHPSWGGKPTPRVNILPVWRHRYTLISGVDPHGEVDALTGATPKHSFSLGEYLSTDADKVLVYLELNLPGDPDQHWPDPHVGQPSVLYAVLIDLTSDQRYYLMQLIGHGGGAEQSGAIAYDLLALGSARWLVEKILVKIDRGASRPSPTTQVSVTESIGPVSQ